MPRSEKDKSIRMRYGIGEWYGRTFIKLTQPERQLLANVTSPRTQLCIPRSTLGQPVQCTKRGGVCSLGLYREDINSGSVEAVLEPASFVTMCPERFKEQGLIFNWVGETILNNKQPLVATEIGFLQREKPESKYDSLISEEGEKQLYIESLKDEVPEDDHEDVGRIDFVLVNPENHQQWCAMELQAVYFSGPSMNDEFIAIRDHIANSLPFPAKIRRPDYRSSGPKRLMPQLQIKVPTLRRWGKRMAVVVDRSFFNALGQMETVSDISNCDIVWFVLDYRISDGDLHLIRDEVIYTTLERAVEGLTAGKPVTMSLFEQRIDSKLNERNKPRKARKRNQSNQ